MEMSTTTLERRMKRIEKAVKKAVTEPEPRRLVSFLFDPYILRLGFGFPLDHKIVGAEWDNRLMSIRMYVEGPACPKVYHGEKIQEIVPVIHTEIDESGNKTHTWDWNIK